MNKSDQRTLIRQLKSQYSAEDLQGLSAEVLSHVEENPHFKSAQTILLYYSLPDEVYTHHFIDKWYQSKKILLPKISGNCLTIHPYHGINSIKESSMHIMEPVTDSYNDYAQIQLAVIPGMAFDKEGHRLGRGKGYYDRLLSLPEWHHIYKLGIAFSFLILENVCHDPHDIIMNEIIT